MEREAIFKAQMMRNVLRQEASLPQIDVHAEYRRLIALEEWRQNHFQDVVNSCNEINNEK